MPNRPGTQSRSLSLLGEADQGNVPSPLDRYGQLTLVAQAITGNPARHDPPPFSQKIPQQPGILKIDCALVQAEPAGAPPLEQPPAATFSSFHHRLLNYLM
jgi:hypothetical protein